MAAIRLLRRSKDGGHQLEYEAPRGNALLSDDVETVTITVHDTKHGVTSAQTVILTMYEFRELTRAIEP